MRGGSGPSVSSGTGARLSSCGARVLNVNVLGMVRTVREFLPFLRARSGWRRILLTASSSVLAPAVRMGTYQTSRTVHHGHMPEIDITGPDTARGTWAMFDYVEWPPHDGEMVLGKSLGLESRCRGA